ncbi:MAG: hypothetical protein DRI46_09320 [Chloroflexi bacterium]|nr:MAG: hypothetical protein DRI46_09320 [Chloroflexota bacterium]
MKSISDEKVRETIKRDAIVTGGSIASMLLGEKVNDYDVYLRTKAGAECLARYYVAEFNRANKQKVGGRVAPFTPEVHTTEDRVRIHIQSAGIAGEDQGEYNYFENQPPAAAAAFVETTLQEKCETDPDRPRYRPVFLSENAITLSDRVQIVVRFFGDVGEIHENYDFVHATCSYDYASDTLTLPGLALECLLSRTLLYQGSLYPVASIFRMKKFLERGWRITAGQQLKIMMQISELDMSSLDVLREQLTGVDMAYLYEVLQIIHKENPDKINATYLATVLDRIFD